MSDQANDLRELVRHCVPAGGAVAQQRPRLLVVAGGKGGVGTTTLAVGLATALERRGTRTLLVDAAPGGDAALLCRVDAPYTLADVLSGARTAAEAIQCGPGELQVLPGSRELAKLSGHPPAVLDRLLAQLSDLGDRAELLVLDAGNSPTHTAQRFWQAADLVLLVSTPELAAVMDTYASIKLLAPRHGAMPLHLVINMSPAAETAQEVGRRLTHACRRFLGVVLQYAGQVPLDSHVSASAAAGALFAVAAPDCTAGRHLHRLAQAMRSVMEKATCISNPKSEIRNPKSKS
jgi:flagellar biosynthesis protein FlhG